MSFDAMGNPQMNDFEKQREAAWKIDELTKNAENREKALEPLIAEVKETNRLLRLLLESKGIII